MHAMRCSELCHGFAWDRGESYSSAEVADRNGPHLDEKRRCYPSRPATPSPRGRSGHRWAEQVLGGVPRAMHSCLQFDQLAKKQISKMDILKQFSTLARSASLGHRSSSSILGWTNHARQRIFSTSLFNSEWRKACPFGKLVSVKHLFAKRRLVFTLSQFTVLVPLQMMTAIIFSLGKKSKSRLMKILIAPLELMKIT